MKRKFSFKRALLAVVLFLLFMFILGRCSVPQIEPPAEPETVTTEPAPQATTEPATRATEFDFSDWKPITT